MLSMSKDNTTLEDYILQMYKNADVELYYKLDKLAKSNTALKNILNIVENQEILQKLKDVHRAKKFRDNAQEFDLDQKNYFLSVCLLILLPEAENAYQYCIEKAEAEVFRYKFCYSEEFRDNLKQQYNLSDAQLEEKFTCNKEEVSILNLQIAVQALDEAMKYARNLDEINAIDKRIKNIIDFYYEQRRQLIADKLN